MADIRKIWLDEVEVGARLRPLDPAAVDVLVESIIKTGLQTPISIRVVEDDRGQTPVLIAGYHRLEAMRRLGWETAMCAVFDGDERDARLWEISENLHRAELTVLERSEHVAEWVRLVNEKPAQLGPVSAKGGRGHEGGINSASRELGLTRQSAQRAVKIDGLSADAKAAARDAGLGDNQSALLSVAATPPEEQTRRIAEIVEARTKPAPAIKNAFESEEDWRRALFTVWNRGAQDWRERALEAMDGPVFDRTRGGVV